MPTFSTPAPILLRFEFGSGTVAVETAEVADSEVTLEPLHAGDGAADDLVAASVVELRGDELVVLVPRRRLSLREPALRLHVRVPHHSRLSGEAQSADLTAAGRFATSSLGTGSGDVRVDDVDGDLRAVSGSGAISVRRVSGATQLKSGSGDLRADELGAAATLTTGSGDVTVGRGSVSLELKSGSGSLSVDDTGEAPTQLKLSSGSGDLSVGRVVAGSVTAKTASGDVAVGVGGGAAVWLDLNTVTGRVHTELDSSEPPADGDPVVEIRATTVTGNIDIRRA